MKSKLQIGLLLSSVLCLFIHVQVTLARPPFLGPSERSASLVLVRGGETTSITSRPLHRPTWLNIDREKLQNYLQIAKERHAEAIRSAEQNYWSGGRSNEASPPSRLPDMDTYGIVPPSTWSLPDFASDLDLSRMVFVTHGHDYDTAATSSLDAETPLFSKEECQQVIQNSEDHFRRLRQPWTTLPSGQYDVAGFWIHSVPAVHEWFNDMIRTRLFPLVQQQFPDFVDSVDDLVVDNAYVFKYTPETGRRTGVHTDSGCLSFTIALNDPSEYTGGGTWFQGLVGAGENSTILMRQGHVTVRPGGVRHCGHAVTSGIRYIIGGFCMHKQKVEYARMLINLGSDRSKSGDLRGAAEALEAAIHVNPHFDGSYSQLSSVYEKMGDTKKAQQVLEHCYYHVNPYCGEVAYSLGVMYLDQKELDKAKECAKTCLELDECDADAMNVMIQVCSLQGDAQGEESWSVRLIETPGVPNEMAASTYANLGVLKEGTEDELVFYEKALRLHPKQFPARYSLSCALAERKQWNQAVESFRQALELARETNRPELNEALKTLYRVASMIVQEEAQRGELDSRKAMGERLVTLMGPANYAELAAASGKK